MLTIEALLPRQRLLGLTLSSSATGTGEVKRGVQNQPKRWCLFAGARG